MATQSPTSPQGGDAGNASQSPSQSQPDADKDPTFTTDISETDDEGTTVREAEVSEKDLQEKKPSGSSGS